MTLTECGQGIDGVRRSAALDLQRRHGEALIVAHRQAAQLEPVLGARVLRRLLVRRHGDRHNGDGVEPERAVGLRRNHEVAEMRRVEHPAEDAEPSRYGRTWPEPSSTYLNEHSPRTPLGPRAWG